MANLSHALSQALAFIGAQSIRLPTTNIVQVGPQSPSRVPDGAAIIERAAILEFSEGLPRADADAQALSEHGLSSWVDLVHRQAEHIEAMEKQTAETQQSATVLRG